MRDDAPPNVAAASGQADRYSPFEVIEGDFGAGLVLICDHAANSLPAEYGDLGLGEEQLRRHIAYDIGAAPLTRALAARLGVPAVLSHFSRLLIDPNRGEDDPTLIMRLSDGAVVPGNRVVPSVERQKRLDRFYAPYHAAVGAGIERALGSGRVPAVLSIHSFTPAWKSVPRRWHAGVLWDADPRLAVPLIAALAADSELVVGDNEPYSGTLRNDTLYKHTTLRGIASAVLEVRQDLIGGETGVLEWTERLAPILSKLVGDPQIAKTEFFGSRTDRL